MRIFSLFLLFGTLLIQWLTVLPSWRIVIVILGLCIGFGFFLNKKSALQNTFLISICAFFLGLTLASYQATQLLNNRISPELEGKELSVTGKIIDIPSVREDGVRFLFDVYSVKPVIKGAIESFTAQQIHKEIKQNGTEINETELNQTELKGIIRLGWFKHAQELHSGELWHLNVKLKRPSGFMNPGRFVAL